MQQTTPAAALNGGILGERLMLSAEGAWLAVNASALEDLVEAAPSRGVNAKVLTVDVGGLGAVDTYGAWLLERLVRSFQDRGGEAELIGIPHPYRGLFDKVVQANQQPAAAARPRNAFFRAEDYVQRWSDGVVADFGAFFAMLGAVSLAFGRVVVRPKTFRLTSAVNQLDRVGWQAVPIIMLITVLIGAIIAQQGFFHFSRFGARDYVADLVGILVLREIGVLIVAIMVAGRSGSSYTAEIGSMKMREEIDALQTMGRDPVEVLILPRIVALVVALPILALIGGLAALFGGGLVAWLYAGMSPSIFLARLHDAISLTHFSVGMVKAPFMALAIGVVACSEGLRVKGSAESLGLQTTTSVVKSIFIVIVLDGIFAIFFASIGM